MHHLLLLEGSRSYPNPPPPLFEYRNAVLNNVFQLATLRKSASCADGRHARRRTRRPMSWWCASGRESAPSPTRTTTARWVTQRSLCRKEEIYCARKYRDNRGGWWCISLPQALVPLLHPLKSNLWWKLCEWWKRTFCAMEVWQSEVSLTGIALLNCLLLFVWLDLVS